MSDDLIRRSDAIEALEREKSDWNCDYNVPIDNCIKRLNKVESANRPQEWIPCKERLPKEAEPILVTINGKTFFAPFGINEESSKELGAVAWMPLPEPWKGADDE